MKKLSTLLLLFVLLNTQNVQAQYEVFASRNFNYYIYRAFTGYDNGHNFKDSKLKMGYNIGASYAFELQSLSQPLSVDFMLNNYKNEFSYSTGGQGGSNSYNFTNNITTLDLGLNLTDFSLLSTHIILGIRSNILLKQQNIGINNYNIYSQGPSLRDVSSRIEKKIFNIGLTARISSNEFPITDKTYLKFYYSLFVFRENFNNFKSTTALQNGLGVVFGLKKASSDHISINQ